MKNKKIKIFVFISIIILPIMCFFVDLKTTNYLSIQYHPLIGVYVVDNPTNASILSEDYQDDVSKAIYNKLNDKLYTPSDPLMILNPYGTNITGLYINFVTFNKAKVEYTISVDDPEIPDFTNTLSSGWTNYHKGQIIGLVKNYRNKLTIKIIDKYNNVKSTHEFNINMLDSGTNAIRKINSNYEDLTKISDGLYVMTSARTHSYESVPISFYDVNGILRAEFTADSGYESFRIQLIDNKLLYAINKTNYVLVNNLGKIEDIFHAQYTSNHDFIYSEHNNSILYVYLTDKIRKLDLNTGEDSLLLDLGELLSDYKQKAYQYAYNKNKNTTPDWTHLNSIEIVNDNDLILSLRDSSSIIYISDVYTEPEIKYIIAPPQVYKNTPYEKYLLKQKGDFILHAGQHAVTIEYDDKLSDDQYYLSFYNNNYAVGRHTFNEGWEKTIIGAGTNEKDAENSMYYKYLVDESEGTFELVDSIDVAYSWYISNVQVNNDGYLIDSGHRVKLQEFDKEKKLLLTLSTDEINVYRGYKFDMKSFWFDMEYHYTEIEQEKTSNSNAKEKNDSEFHYNEKTNTITSVNVQSNKFKESDLIYHDTIYFTIYDYENKTLTIPSNINGTEIKKILGLNIGNVKKVIIEEGIEEIGNYAFFGSSNIEEIVLPSTLKKIGRHAFGKCTSIKKITIPKSVNTIGEYAFYDWKANQTVITKANYSYGELWKGSSEATFKEV